MSLQSFILFQSVARDFNFLMSIDRSFQSIDRSFHRSILLIDRSFLSIHRSFQSFLSIDRSFLSIDRSFLSIDRSILLIDRSFLSIDRSISRSIDRSISRSIETLPTVRLSDCPTAKKARKRNDDTMIRNQQPTMLRTSVSSIHLSTYPSRRPVPWSSYTRLESRLHSAFCFIFLFQGSRFLLGVFRGSFLSHDSSLG